MSGWAIAAALLCGLDLGAVGLAWVSLIRSRAWMQILRLENERLREEQDAAIASLQERLESLAAQIQELRVQSAAGGRAPAAPSGGAINLSRRSQALRLRRRGEEPAQIAAALEIPLQEVQLLLKVHEIVMSRV